MRGAQLTRAAALAFSAIVLSAAAAQAREPTAEERAALKQTVAEFSAAMTTNDMAKVIDVMPPKLLDQIAKTASIAPEALRQGLAQQMTNTMAQVKISSFTLDLEHARFPPLPSGAPYGLIPTQTNMEIGEQKVVAKSDTLAVLDGAKWYLVRLEQAPQVQMFVQAYPEFANVKFEPGSMTAAPK